MCGKFYVRWSVIALPIILWWSLSRVQGRTVPAERDIDITFFEEENNNVLQFTWYGASSDVRSGVTWYLTEHDDGVRVPIGRFDWLGFHRLRGGSAYTGDSFIYYGPPKDGNTTTVYVGGWLRLPPGVTGVFECAGYGQSSSVTVLPRSKVALFPNTDKNFVAPYTFRCLPATDEEELYRATPPDKRTLEIRWWQHGGHLASITWNSSANIAGGDVRQTQALDSSEPYFIDSVSGDLFVFSRDTARRMSCLRCTRRGYKYTTSSWLGCQIPEETASSHPKTVPTSKDDSSREAFAHRVMLVITWIVASVAVIAVAGVLLVNGIALYQGCSWSSISRALTAGTHDHRDYDKLSEST